MPNFCLKRLIFPRFFLASFSSRGIPRHEIPHSSFLVEELASLLAMLPTKSRQHCQDQMIRAIDYTTNSSSSSSWSLSWTKFLSTKSINKNSASTCSRSSYNFNIIHSSTICTSLRLCYSWYTKALIIWTLFINDTAKTILFSNAYVISRILDYRGSFNSVDSNSAVSL